MQRRPIHVHVGLRVKHDAHMHKGKHRGKQKTKERSKPVSDEGPVARRAERLAVKVDEV